MEESIFDFVPMNDIPLEVFNSHFISSDEYAMWSNVITTLFIYMNGKINTVNKWVQLQIHPINLHETQVRGNFNNMNIVNIFISNTTIAYDACSDGVKEMYPDRMSCLFTDYAFSIAHELAHADQEVDRSTIAMSNPSYLFMSENQVNEIAYQFLISNQQEIEGLFDGMFKIILPWLSYHYERDRNPIIPNDYKRRSVDDLFITTLRNHVLIPTMGYYIGVEQNIEEMIKAIPNVYVKYISTIYWISKDPITEWVCVRQNGEFVADNFPFLLKLLERHEFYFSDYRVWPSIHFYEDKNNTLVIEIKKDMHVIEPAWDDE